MKIETHQKRYRIVTLLIYCVTLFAITGNAQAQNSTQEYENEQPPDVHFWTNDAGVPQLDFRALNPFVSTTGARSNFPKYVNLYGGGINNGDWRGISVKAFDSVRFINAGTIFDDKRIMPPIFAEEHAQMHREDCVAQSGSSAISSINIESTGILWGPLRPKPRKKFDFNSEKKFFHREFNGQSCLLGPVRITAYYIRFDGPVSAIGDDVELNAQRIVVNGIDLPPAHWREALAQFVQTKTSQSSTNLTSAPGGTK